MKVFKEIGSKERFLEMYQNVNKFKLNEDAVNGLESYDILNTAFKKFKSGELKVNKTNTYLDDDETYVTVECQGDGVICEFNFKVTFNESNQDDVYNVEDVELMSYKHKSTDNEFKLEGDMLKDFNSKYGGEFYDLIDDYIEVDNDQSPPDLYEDIDKKIDSMPFGHHSDDIQKSVDYGNKKPVNSKLRIKSKPDKYVPVINENIDNIVSNALQTSFNSMNDYSKAEIIEGAKKSVDTFLKQSNITQPSRKEYGEMIKEVANMIVAKLSSVVNEVGSEPIPNEVGGNLETQYDFDDEYVEPKLPARFEDDEALEGGLGDGAEPMEFPPQEILKGMEVEMEHTDDPKIALEITMDHLTEDPQYYSKHEKCYSDEDENMRDTLLGYSPKNVGEY